MPQHTITKRELQSIIVSQELAASHGSGENKSLTFKYDIGRKRLYFVVQESGGTFAYDDLDEAIEAYNEAR